MLVETFVTKRIKKSPYKCTVIFLKKMYFCALSYMGLNFVKKNAFLCTKLHVPILLMVKWCFSGVPDVFIGG